MLCLLCVPGAGWARAPYRADAGDACPPFCGECGAGVGLRTRSSHACDVCCDPVFAEAQHQGVCQYVGPGLTLGWLCRPPWCFQGTAAPSSCSGRCTANTAHFRPILHTLQMAHTVEENVAALCSARASGMDLGVQTAKVRGTRTCTVTLCREFRPHT